jgi:hypothetical protein
MPVSAGICLVRSRAVGEVAFDVDCPRAAVSESAKLAKLIVDLGLGFHE